MQRLLDTLFFTLLLCISSACFAASPNLTTIPAATQIIDANGAVWTVTGDDGECLLNGVQAGGCSNVQTLLWYNGQVYVYNM